MSLVYLLVRKIAGEGPLARKYNFKPKTARRFEPKDLGRALTEDPNSPAHELMQLMVRDARSIQHRPLSWLRWGDDGSRTDKMTG